MDREHEHGSSAPLTTLDRLADWFVVRALVLIWEFAFVLAAVALALFLAMSSKVQESGRGAICSGSTTKNTQAAVSASAPQER